MRSHLCFTVEGCCYLMLWLQVCERLQRLTNLQHLSMQLWMVALCSDAGVLESLATSLCNLTHLSLREHESE